MIDLTRIRSVKTLETMKKDLDFFIKEPVFEEIYLKDNDWGEEDLDADRESAAYLIGRIDMRIKSLGRMKDNLDKEIRHYKKLETEETEVISPMAV